jgi:hypothetical protein
MREKEILKIPVAVEWTANDEGAANGEEQATVVESRECEKLCEAAAGLVRRTLVAIWIGDGTSESESPA